MRATGVLVGSAVALVLAGPVALGTSPPPLQPDERPVVAAFAPEQAPVRGRMEALGLPRVRAGADVVGQRPPRPLGSPGADGQPDSTAVIAYDAEVFDPGPAAGIDPVIITPEGFQVVPGSARAGDGPSVTYTVEVEPGLGIDPLAVAAAVEEALHDPRGWAADVTLTRVDDVDAATIRVLLAAPLTVDRLCAEAGLDTGGRFSCWNGTFAALNAMRWAEGAFAFEELTTYRRYLVNHEFGHGLGYGHEDCDAPGDLAPVMMQQTKGTDGCEANGWPYPERPPS